MTGSAEAMRRAQSLSWVSAAETRAVHDEGGYSKGKQRVLVVQTITMCRPEHPRWRLRGQLSLDAGNPPGSTHTTCGLCHPPVAFDDADVEWVT